jgi:Acetyltransferase (GNAT) family
MAGQIVILSTAAGQDQDQPLNLHRALFSVVLSASALMSHTLQHCLMWRLALSFLVLRTLVLYAQQSVQRTQCNNISYPSSKSCLGTLPCFAGLPVGSELVKMAIREMIRDGCEEVVLEAEVCNTGALKLYQALGFVRDKRLHRWG